MLWLQNISIVIQSYCTVNLFQSQVNITSKHKLFFIIVSAKYLNTKCCVFNFRLLSSFYIEVKRIYVE